MPDSDPSCALGLRAQRTHVQVFRRLPPWCVLYRLADVTAEKQTWGGLPVVFRAAVIGARWAVLSASRGPGSGFQRLPGTEGREDRIARARAVCIIKG